MSNKTSKVREFVDQCLIICNVLSKKSRRSATRVGLIDRFRLQLTSSPVLMFNSYVDCRGTMNLDGSTRDKTIELLRASEAEPDVHNEVLAMLEELDARSVEVIDKSLNTIKNL